MKSKIWKKTAAGVVALLISAAYIPAMSAYAKVPDFGAVTDMPDAPFGTAGDSAPYYSKPCNERLASIPEALMKLTADGYSWEYTYVEDKPEWSLTLMDYANIYSFIHSNELDTDTVREILADSDSMVHRKAFTEEEIELLLGDDEAAAMAYFAAPSTIVIGEKGYSAKWMYYHTVDEYEAEGITPEMVAAVLPYYYNPLYVQDAADRFSQKLSQYVGKLGATKWHQWTAGDINIDGKINVDDIELLTSFLDNKSALTFTQWASADMDGDSDVDADDLTSLQEKMAAGIEDKGVMLDVIEFCQYPDYPTGCESVSLYMLLNYYGVNVTVDNIYDLLPMGAQPYDDEEGLRHGANPEREFVGDPRSPYSYGVFNEPIASVADQFKPGVKTERSVTIDRIKEVLDSGHPVLAWYVSQPKRDIMYRWKWVDEQNEVVSWPGGEHAIVVCGYDDDSITYRDPNAGTTVCIDYATFEKSFTELGGRIVYYTDEEVEAVSFVGKNGLNLFAQPTYLNGSETALEAGWYAVSGDVTMNKDTALNGDVKLILTDGAKLNVTGKLSGAGALTVYGQTEGTGILNGKIINASSFTQYGGKTVLTSDAEYALTGSKFVSLLGGKFESNSGVSSEGTITLGYAKNTDYIQAARYEAQQFGAADGKILYIPELPNDLSLLPLSASVSLVYNGEIQQPTKDDILGKIWIESPLIKKTYSTGDKQFEFLLKFLENQKLCQYPEDVDPYNFSLEIKLNADDFDLGKVEAGKDSTVSVDGKSKKDYSVEIVGKGSYTGTAVIGWRIEQADVSADITVKPKSSIISDGSRVKSEDFEITASSPLAQALVNEIAEGKAQAPIGVYSTAPLTGENITSECKADIALEKGHIYDLHNIGSFTTIVIKTGEGADNLSTIMSGKLDDKIYVLKDGKRMNGCFEIESDGALCYYKVNENGDDLYVKGQQGPNMYWAIRKIGGSAVMPMYAINQDFMEAQKTEAVEPGDYVARMIISENESNNYANITKLIPFTVEESTVTPDKQIAPDETLLKWAAKDYQNKTGTNVTAFLIEKLDGELAIALKDTEGNNVMSYEINTVTGTGIDSNGETVNLPQTGMNSLINIFLPILALVMTIVGAIMLGISRMLRRKTDDNVL